MAILKIKDNNNVWHIIKALKGKDGINLEFEWNGTKLGVKTSEEKEFKYVDLKGETGQTGATGMTGNSIKNIEKLSTKDNVDTYAVNFTDGTQTTFNVTNGEVSLDELKEVDSKVESNYEEFENLKSELLATNEVRDSFINVGDSYKEQLLNLSIDGVLKQNTTQGNNLLNINNLENKTINGVSLTKNDDGTITLNGTATADANFRFAIDDIEATTNYAIQLYKFQGSFTNNYVSIYLSEDSQFSTFHLLSLTSQNFVFSNLENKTYKYAQIKVNSGVICNNLNIGCQIVKDKDIKTFEKFTGGEPSPSPNFPQKIETLTGNIKLTSCNKNLIPNYDFEVNNMYGLSVIAKNNKLSIKGLIPKINYSSIILFADGSYEVGQWWGTKETIKKQKGFFGNNKLNKILSFFLKGNISNSKFRLVLGYETYTDFVNYTIISNKEKLIDTKEKLNYICFGFTPETTIDIEILLQLEQSSTATSFVEHLESMVNINLPEGEFIGKLNETYKDELVAVYNQEEGQYHLILNKNVIKIVMDGLTNRFFHISSSIFSETNKFFQFEVPNKEIGKSGSVDYAESNYLTYFEGNAANAVKRSCLWWEGSEKYNYASLPFKTIEDANNWLKQINDAGNPFEIYYVTRNPYQVDLGPIDMLKTYENVTNIFTDSDLLPSIQIKYYKNFKETIKDLKINEKSLKDELQNLNERLSALETKQVVSSDNSNVENGVIS